MFTGKNEDEGNDRERNHVNVCKSFIFARAIKYPLATCQLARVCCSSFLMSTG